MYDTEMLINVETNFLNRNIAGSKIKIKHVVYTLLVLALIVVIVLLILLIATSSSTEVNEEAPPEKLDSLYGPVKYVNIFYRHGARNPDSLPPNDPHKDMKNWPEGLGELTEEGMMQHYDIGIWLAKRYKHLLPDDQSKTNQAIRVISTDWNRTIMSAQSELAGMFPVNNPSSSISQLVHRPVPIHVISYDADDLILVTKKCDRYEALTEELKKSKEYLDEINRYNETTKILRENYGIKINIRSYLALYGNLQIEAGRGFPQPSWVKDVYPQPLEHLVNITVMAETWNLELKRLRGGPFVKTILANFNDKLSGLQVRNMTMYSAHDTALASILNTMDVYDFIPPPFASIVLFELRQPDGSEPVVTIWYKNSTSPPFTLTLPNCEEACPLSTMETLLKPIIPDDWDKECQHYVGDQHPLHYSFQSSHVQSQKYSIAVDWRNCWTERPAIVSHHPSLILLPPGPSG